MSGIESRDFNKPDATRSPTKTLIELVTLAGGEVGRYTFQPGWRWSEHIKPVAKTESCQTEHVGYALSGTLHVKHDDGTEMDILPGMAYHIGPGHDGWNAGNEPVVLIEFQGAVAYASG